MSTMDESHGDKKPAQMVFTDINDNVQPMDEHSYFRDKMQLKKELKKDVDGFPNFDMWNSSLLSVLPHSDPSSPMIYEPLDKLPKKSLRDWKDGAEYLPPQLSLINGYSSESGVASYHPNCNLHPTNKTVDQTRSIRYQNYPAYYVLLQSPAYLYSKDAIACPQSSLVAHHDSQLYERNEQIGIVDPSSVQIGEKFSEIWRRGVLTKMGNDDAISRSVNPLATSCYVQNYAPNLLNFTPICTPAENATSGLVSLDVVNSNDEIRLRPILKQETVRVK